MTNKSVWDKTAKNYDKIIKKDKKAYAKIFSMIKPYVKNKKVLELGAGTCIVTHNIFNDTKSIIASDFSKEMIKMAIGKNDDSKIKYMVEDATNLSFEKEKFDVVIIMNCLHIMEKPEKVLCEIYRVLNKNGILIAPNFCSDNLIRKTLSNIVSKIKKVKFRNFEPLEYLDFLEKNKFKVVKNKLIKSSFPIQFVVLKKGEENEYRKI